MESTIKQRLKLFMKAIGIKQVAFEESIGASNGYINSISKSIGGKFLVAIEREYPQLNRDWLLTGEGEMMNDGIEEVQNLGTPKSEIRENLTDVRFFTVSPTATFQEFCSGAIEYPSVISILKSKGDILDESACVFEVIGNSMAPQIQSGAQILCNEVSPTKWHLLKNGVIVIAYRDKFVIKRVIKNRLESENYLILGSDNSEFPEEQNVALSDIRCIFRASRIITQPIN